MSEEIQDSVITAIADMFDIIDEETYGNWLFRTLSRSYF